MLYNNIVPDIAWIAKTEVLKEGLYSTDYKVATSYHFYLDCIKKIINLREIKISITILGWGRTVL